MAEHRPDWAVTSVEMTGPVTRAEVASWKEVLLEALARGRGVRLDLSGSGPWDLVGLQLLVSVEVSAGKAGASFRLLKVPEVFWSVAERASLRDRFTSVAE